MIAVGGVCVAAKSRLNAGFPWPGVREVKIDAACGASQLGGYLLTDGVSGRAAASLAGLQSSTVILDRLPEPGPCLAVGMDRCESVGS